MLNETIKLIIREFFDQKISCMGLLTAQNPQEKEQEENLNKSLNDILLDDIQSLGFESFPTYYHGEEGFLIPNISKQQLVELGKKYNQRFVIWGKKVPEDKNGMTFNWELIEGGKIRNEKISHHPFVCPNFN